MAESLRWLNDPDTVVALNSAFDRTLMRHCWKLDIGRRWRDTMVQALAHGLPGSLERSATLSDCRPTKPRTSEAVNSSPCCANPGPRATNSESNREKPPH